MAGKYIHFEKNEGKFARTVWRVANIYIKKFVFHIKKIEFYDKTGSKNDQRLQIAQIIVFVREPENFPRFKSF